MEGAVGSVSLTMEGTETRAEATLRIVFVVTLMDIDMSDHDQ
jgi:hypothetical protein